MKKFLKSEICVFVNSTWMHYSQLTWSNSVAGTKRKEKKRRRQKTQTQLLVIRIQTHT